MGLARALFAGDIGNWMDTDDNRRRIRTMRAHLRTRHAVDRAQNERLDLLEQENEQLKLCLGSLARVLVERGVISAEELSEYGALIEDESDGA